MHKHQRYINRELSWLSFNARVLEEAQDPGVPLLERLKFLGIFSNNLDEFYRVRIAYVKRIMKLGSKAKSTFHRDAADLLDEIQSIVIEQNRLFEAAYKSIRAELRNHGVDIISEKKLSASQQHFVRSFFIEQLRPTLVPIMLHQVKSFPALKDAAIYLVVKLTLKKEGHNRLYSLVEVPTSLFTRFVLLPSEKNMKVIILVDDIIRFCLPELFPNLDIDKAEAHTIKLTRDQELDLDSDISQSLMEKLERSIKNRQKGTPVRFVYDENIASDTLEYLRTAMKLHKYDNLIPAGRYHNFKDFIHFPNLGLKELTNAALKPLMHPHFAQSRSAFDAIAQQDILLHYPYQSFTHFIDWLREAAIDPKVRSIKMTLYRAARRSQVMNALINAARNGKQITLVVELQARFDEEANIHWAKELADEGIHVIYGVPQLKVHSKVVLIERIEEEKKQLYATISTGNFNEGTATVYCDDALFTADKRLCNEVKSLFEFFEKNYLQKNYKHLILSPNRTRSKLIKLIDSEIKNAKAGRPSGITLKINSLVDENIIDWLYKASAAGVPVDIIVRGMCSIVAGVPGLSENIRVISIIDRFLEHSRVFVFHNAAKPLYYISSADIMSRNLDSRIEVTCPIYDPALQRELQQIIDTQWADRVKQRVLLQGKSLRHKQGTQSARSAKTKADDASLTPGLRSQTHLYELFQQGLAAVRQSNLQREGSKTIVQQSREE